VTRLDELRPGGWDPVWRDSGLSKSAGDPFAYLRREGDAIAAIDPACTHLGCPVRYVDSSQGFICPCHAGIFDADGRPGGGPVRRPLLRRETRVVDGDVYVGPRRGTIEIPGATSPRGRG
jgi:Rieske Fe-S protein